VFPEAVFHGEARELPHGEHEGRSRKTGITAQKGHCFCSDRWIVLKCLQEFSEAVFGVGAVESLLGEDEVWTRQTSKTTETGHNF